jgi:hypothetical protein
MDLLSKHSEAPFHVLVGGGDQLYCDACVSLLFLCEILLELTMRVLYSIRIMR